MSDQTIAETNDINTTELATALTVAWLSNPNNRVSADDVPTFLNTMHQTLTGLSGFFNEPRTYGLEATVKF